MGGRNVTITVKASLSDRQSLRSLGPVRAAILNDRLRSQNLHRMTLLCWGEFNDWLGLRALQWALQTGWGIQHQGLEIVLAPSRLCELAFLVLSVWRESSILPNKEVGLRVNKLSLDLPLFLCPNLLITKWLS